MVAATSVTWRSMPLSRKLHGAIGTHCIVASVSVLNAPTVQRMRMVAVPGRVISLSDELDDGPSRRSAIITFVNYMYCSTVPKAVDVEVVFSF